MTLIVFPKWNSLNPRKYIKLIKIKHKIHKLFKLTSIINALINDKRSKLLIMRKKQNLSITKFMKKLRNKIYTNKLTIKILNKWKI